MSNLNACLAHPPVSFCFKEKHPVSDERLLSTILINCRQREKVSIMKYIHCTLLDVHYKPPYCMTVYISSIGKIMCFKLGRNYPFCCIWQMIYFLEVRLGAKYAPLMLSVLSTEEGIYERRNKRIM